MPDTVTSTSSARPVRRVGRTVNVIIQISLFVAAVVAANYLSCTNHKRYDLTEKRNFSLSDFSEKFLKGKMLQEHQSPVQAIVVMRRTSPHYSRVYHLLDEYQRIAGDAIKLEFIDPLRQTDRTLELEAIYGIKYSEDMIIIDGLANEDIANNDGQPSQTSTSIPSTGDAKADKANKTAQKTSGHLRVVRVSLTSTYKMTTRRSSHGKMKM